MQNWRLRAGRLGSYWVGAGINADRVAEARVLTPPTGRRRRSLA